MKGPISRCRSWVLVFIPAMTACGERIVSDDALSRAMFGDISGDGESLDDSGSTDGDDGDGDGNPGDGDGDPGDGDGDDNSNLVDPNWHEDIAPLVHERCVGCHRDGGIAPMALDSYASASAWSDLMLESINAGTMPPWGAETTERCEPEHAFVDDPSLSGGQREMFAAWIEDGVPEGDPDNAAPLPPLPSLELDNISAQYQNASPFVANGPGDDYVCFSMDLGLDETKYLDGIQMLPDNDQIVHHVLVWITHSAPTGHPGPYPCFATPQGGIPLSEAKLVSIWVPGAPPTVLPDGVSVEVPAGSHVVLAYHYHPPGPGEYVDRSTVALRWQDEPTPWSGEFELLGILPSAPNLTTSPFMIPAGATDHPETIGQPWGNAEVSLFSVGTHMHYVGRDQLIAIQRAGQSVDEADCMVHTPAWDFSWQRLYDIDLPLDQLPTLGAGDRVWMDCRYDNTLDNPGVVQALSEQGLDQPQDTYWGENTLDEMCVALLGVAWQP